jgi:hypothetical protein
MKILLRKHIRTKRRYSMLKAKDYSKLIPKVIIDKNGHKKMV